MANYRNITESQQITSRPGFIKGFVVNTHSSGTLALLDGTEPSTAATSTLTSAGACAPASHALATLTGAVADIVNGKKIVIDTVTYTFKTTPTTAYDVKRGTSMANSLDNLKAAINGTGVGDGSDYYAGTVAHPTVVATTNSNTQQVIRARVPGTAANAYVTTSDDGNYTWDGATMNSGTPGVTTAAATITLNGRVYTAVLELSETLGATAVADQILWVTSEAVFLDNVKKAINGSGIAGTDYSTGTTRNNDCVATTNSNTQQVVNARVLGTGGNAITTTTTLANYSWTGAVFASGTGAAGRVLFNTITFPAVTVGPLTWEFPEEISLDYGLYATIGGTSADITIQYN